MQNFCLTGGGGGHQILADQSSSALLATGLCEFATNAIAGHLLRPKWKSLWFWRTLLGDFFLFAT